MDISLLIILWIVFTVVQGILQKKNPKQPQQTPQDLPPENLNFEIPTLANDPNFPNEEPIIFSEDLKQSAEVREINLKELYSQKKSEIISQKKFNEVESGEQKNFSLDLTPTSAMNAIILSEILGKPKALRRR